MFFCISFGHIYLSLRISLSSSFLTVSGLFCCEFFETLVLFLAIFLSIKSPLLSAVFWMTLIEEVLSAFVADFLAWSRRF